MSQTKIFKAEASYNEIKSVTLIRETGNFIIYADENGKVSRREAKETERSKFCLTFEEAVQFVIDFHQKKVDDAKHNLDYYEKELHKAMVKFHTEKI